MRPLRSQPTPATAILTLVEIKAAVEAFDRGDTNVFDALDAIAEAIQACRNAAASRRDAA